MRIKSSLSISNDYFSNNIEKLCVFWWNLGFWNVLQKETGECVQWEKFITNSVERYYSSHRSCRAFRVSHSALTLSAFVISIPVRYCVRSINQILNLLFFSCCLETVFRNYTILEGFVHFRRSWSTAHEMDQCQQSMGWKAGLAFPIIGKGCS